MVAVRTLSEAVGNLYSSTWQKMRNDAIDNVFDNTALFFWLRDKGKFRSVTGSKRIEETLMYGSNSNVGWITKGQAVPLNDYERLTTASFDWKYIYGSLIRFGIEEQQNSGKFQIIDLVKNKLENTKLSIQDNLEDRLFSDESSDDQLEGLQHLIQDDPTATDLVGGIDQNTHNWWRNKYKDMTGLSWASNGATEMRTMMNDCSQNRGSDMPDIIVSGQTPFEHYEDSILEHYRVSNNKLGDKGFHNITFKGIPMIWSQACSNQRMYMLNTNYINLVYDPKMWFTMTPWKEIADQPNDSAAQIMSACTLTTNRRRTQGVLHTIDTP